MPTEYCPFASRSTITDWREEDASWQILVTINNCIHLLSTTNESPTKDFRLFHIAQEIY